MDERKNQLRDYIRSGFSWFLVGTITLLFFIPVFFYFAIHWFFDPPRKHIHFLISNWGKAVLWANPVMKVRFEGMERLKKGEKYVFVANHQSLTDILAVLHLNHPFKFIAKKELFWIPFFGWALYLAGFIPLERGNPKSGKDALNRARQYLKEGVSVLFFPEGTRSLDGEIQAFKFGAFKLAQELSVPTVPLVINGTRNILPKGTKLIGRTAQVTVRVESPHNPTGFSVDNFTHSVREHMIHSLNEMRSQGVLI